MNFESAVEGLDIKLLFPDMVKVEVGSHDNLLGPDRAQLSKLVFSHEGLLLANLLKHAEHEGLILFEVVDKDSLLVGVPVPVLRLVFLVALGVTLEYSVGLTDARGTVDPLVVHESGIGLMGASLVEVDSRLDARVILDGNEAVIESFLSADSNELLVLASSVALDIKLNRRSPKGPGSCNPSLLLVAVGVGAVVELYSRKVGFFAVALEMSNPLLLLELDKELDVRRSVLTLF